MRKLLVAGNWKMHGDVHMVHQLLSGVIEGLGDNQPYQVAVFPSDVFLSLATSVVSDSGLVVGGQTLSQFSHGGAHTGETSAEMLLEAGCEMVLVGHSERRFDNHESSEEVALKYERAISAGLRPILCVGESLQERKSEQTMDVVWRQISCVVDKVGMEGISQGVVAYEPVWAIGTGLTASPEEAQQVHQFIRSQLAEKDDTIARRVQILYGGSCKGQNAHALFSMPDIDGGLIGGAALTSEDFLAICAQAHKVCVENSQ